MANSTFEYKVHETLQKQLLSRGEVDAFLPEAVDIESKWETIGQSYMPDGVREFAHYPQASLGWMMYVGMAVAKFWDDDWSIYGNLDDLYLYLRGKSGYDLLDEYVRGPLLGLRQPEFDDTEHLVQDCTHTVYSLLQHENYEAGTESAFRGYVACLHQLYLFGAYVQLHRMGYHMEKCDC